MRKVIIRYIDYIKVYYQSEMGCIKVQNILLVFGEYQLINKY